LGWVVSSDFGPIEPGIETALLAVLAQSGFGPTLVAIEDAPQIFSVLTAIQSHEAYLVHADDLRRAAPLIDDEVRQRLEAGARISDSTYRDALQFRDRFRKRIAALLERYDIFAMPTVPMLAPRIGERTPAIAGKKVEVRAALLSLTSPWNLSGVPAISIPGGTIGALPFGLQLICASGRERTLFDVAARIERTKKQEQADHALSPARRFRDLLRR
jgi:aspartyl-tRNA(Asn)/glutamyl-tRNA(Gln) amidotransferase subunit A